MRKIKFADGCALAALCFTVAPAFGQPVSGSGDTALRAPQHGPTDDGTATRPDDIVVTGSALPQRRFDADYAVNVLSTENIQKLAPTSFADLLGNIPGIQVEQTGGEVQNVTRLRGIPTDRGLIKFEQDGLPVFNDLDGIFFNGGDGMNRYDLMTDRVEVIRGGPAPIYASGAAGVVNNITVTGTDQTRGRAQLTLGTTGLYRADLVQSGPLGKDTYYAIGGFLRYNDGYRDNGFPNDKGGQIRGNVKHDFEGGSFKISGEYVNDHNVFYLPIPVADPNDPSRSLNPWLNYFTGTANSPVFQNVVIKYRDGSGTLNSMDRDLSNGRYMRFGNIGLDYERSFGNWNVSLKTGLTKGKNSFDALYSTTNPSDANALAASNLKAAQTAFGPGVTHLGYAIGGTNGAKVYDPYSQSGLVMIAQYRAVDSKFYSWQSDLSLTGSVDTGFGKHDLKLGVYGSMWGETQFSAYQDYLVQVVGKPQTLDLIAYSAAGNILGYVTDKGAYHDTTTLADGKVDAKMIAVYANDTWQVTDRLRIDAGFRQEWYNMVSNAAATATFNYGDAATLADNSARAFTGAIVNTVFDTTATNWTVGANYDFFKGLGVYARASRLEVPISAGTLINVAPVTDASNANQYEIGLKANYRGSYLYLTGFYTKFSPLNSTFGQYNPVTGRNDQNVKFIGDVVTKGVEGDGHLKLTSFFYIDASVTVQDPQYKNLTAASDVDLSQVFGNQIIRDPKLYGHVRPSFDFEVSGARASIYGNWAFVGRRYVDANMLTALPAYSTFGAGALVKVGTWRFQVVGDNLTNAHGLTEGNTRTDSISGQGTATAVYGRPIFGRNFRFVLSKSW